MFTCCEECTRLWREYATTAAEQMHTADLLRRAAWADSADDIAKLTPKSRETAHAHENAREAILQHELTAHAATPQAATAHAACGS